MNKLAKRTVPNNHTLEDFECFGPAATKDAEFNGTKISDLGCFDQNGKDSNKFYHGSIIKSKKNNSWYVYFEWGRLGTKPDFQFYECSSENEAQKIYEDQLHSKNDKRGIWENHPTLGKILKPKPGKDMYYVRPQTIRVTGLPDAKRICNKVTTVTKSTFDEETEKLLSDLRAGVINYTKNNFSSGFIPGVEAINEARTILGEASKTKVQKELDELTRLLYSRIPKNTIKGEKVTLNADNIKSWSDDLDAFEDAYNNVQSGGVISNLKYELKFIPRINQLFDNISHLVKSATNNRHSYIPKGMEILRLWEVTNTPDWFKRRQEAVAKEFSGKNIPIIFQPQRNSLEKSCNCAILFHGSRTVNIGSIITNGFRLPKHLNGVQINGANLGPGCYHACDWKKSAGYCSIDNGYWSRGSGQVSNRKAFMFINDVILGNSYIVNKPNNFTSPPNGYHSVTASGGSFQNEEYVVYQEDMFYPRFLIEFTI